MIQSVIIFNMLNVFHGTYVVCDAYVMFVWRRLGAWRDSKICSEIGNPILFHCFSLDPRRTESFAVAEDRDEELCRSEVALTMVNSRLEVVILSPMSDPRTQVPSGVIYIRIHVGEYPTNRGKFVQVVENQVGFQTYQSYSIINL